MFLQIINSLLLINQFIFSYIAHKYTYILAHEYTFLYIVKYLHKDHYRQEIYYLDWTDTNFY